MTLDEAKAASAAYGYYYRVLTSIEALKLVEGDDVDVGLGERSLSYFRTAELSVPRDLVDRMLSHALARAKAKIDGLPFDHLDKSK